MGWRLRCTKIIFATNIRAKEKYSFEVILHHLEIQEIVMTNKFASTSQPHIAIFHVDSIPANTFADFTQLISCDELNLQIESHEESGPYAALEWLLPTAVIVYISKSYFDGFLKEMGKDHYNLLKAGFKKLSEKVIGPSAPKITLLGSSGKISKEQLYSPVFSVLAEIDSEIKFKLLISIDSSQEEYEQGIQAFLAFLYDFHLYKLDSGMIEILNSAQVINGVILLAFNQETKAIEVIDPISKRFPPNEA